MIYIGIDLGGTKTEIAAIKGDPNNILFRKRIPTNRELGYENIINQIIELYDQCSQEVGKGIPLGIGIPGSISNKTGLVRNANLKILNGKPFLKDLKEKIGIKIKIANDANCFTLSEFLFGAAKQYTNAIGLIMGTGFGAGIILNNKLIEGNEFISGELGHLSIDINGPKCWCGNHGCIELYLSGSGLENTYFQRTNIKKKGNQILNDYRNNDELAIITMNDFFDHFGRALANFCVAIDPQIIVIGGGLSKVDELYSQGAIKIKQNMIDPFFSYKIVPAVFGDSSGVFGAAMLNKIDD